MFVGERLRVSVTSTQIFARHAGWRQILVYAMQISSADQLAMILPLPVAAGTREDAVRFIDLSKYPGLFADLDACFPRPPQPAAPRPQSLAAAASPLRVQQVGAFEASFVPSRADFTRLDPRFRIADAIWARLPNYDDWGFAVVQLGPGRQDVHPMALSFPKRFAERLFFPTTHIHDGALRQTAEFNHTLYFQRVAQPRLSGAGSEAASVAAASEPVAQHVELARCQGVVDGAESLARVQLFGSRANEDVWLEDLAPAAAPDRSPGVRALLRRRG